MKQNTSLADALFGKTKKAVISILYSKPEKSWHLRELARAAFLSPTMLGKEINLLASAGIVLDTADGNRRMVRANPGCPIFDELRGLARKTAGVADIVKEALFDIPGIDFAFIFGSVARGQERADSNVDVCVIGAASPRNINDVLGSVEATLGRPINPIVYTAHELRDKVLRQSPFVSNMLVSEKLFLIGDNDGLERTVRPSGSVKPDGAA